MVGAKFECDFAATKEEFSKTKFVYFEMSNKQEFVSDIVKREFFQISSPDSLRLLEESSNDPQSA